MTGSPHAATVEREFQRVLHDRLLRTAFQPIVNVGSGEAVGYEGLVRGPAGSILESPAALIKEAYREKRVIEFDWIARASASRSALAAGLSFDELLFLKIEPLALASDCPPDLWPPIEEAFRKIPGRPRGHRTFARPRSQHAARTHRQTEADGVRPGPGRCGRGRPNHVDAPGARTRCDQTRLEGDSGQPWPEGDENPRLRVRGGRTNGRDCSRRRRRNQAPP
jgi:hypothetical protein